VTPGTNPTSTGLGVSCNLADIGGALQFMYDDATHGDVTAGDNVFSYSAMVDPGTTPGPKSIFCIVNDAQSRTATTSISLTVTEPSGPPLVVVSQVYGGGGNSGATYKNDFIELYSRGTGAESLTGWSVQYASATGSTWQVTNLTSFSLQPGQYYLVQEAQGSGGSVNLPTPDATGTIAMSATAGKVALVNTTTALSGTCPTGATIADFVGYGAANCFEGSGATAAPSNTTAALRKGAGATDTNDNAADFTVGAPNPRNSGTQDAAPTVTSRNPGNGASDVAVDSNVTIGFSEPVNVSGNWYSISCGTSGAHTASVSGGGQSFTLNPDTDFAGSEQ